MTIIPHLPFCALDRGYALFDEYRHLTQGQLFNVLSPRVAAAGAFVRQRRHHHHHHHHCRAASTAPSSTKHRRSQHQHRHQHQHQHQHLHQHRHRHQFYQYQNHRPRHSFSKITKKLPAMASHQEIRRRSSAADRTTVEPSVFAATSTLIPPDKPSPPTTTAPDGTNYNHHVTTRSWQNLNRLSGSDARTMPPPPLPAEHNTTPSSSSARHSRSDSAARIPNRLSLTLPIALPNSDPSRPMPSASASTPSSVPPTPQDGSAMPSPSNVNEFIIAIAAKERKVMELKEELAREETELAFLKKQFSSTGALHQRGGATQLELGGSRTATPTATESDALSPRRSVDLDRRAQFLQNQGTPTQSRRRVMRGGHTRTLSLLSPAKATSDFSILDEHTATATEDSRFPLAANRTPHHAPNPALLKRASWQPRSQQDSPVVPQIVEDFKLGLRAFVEDIRQITIGDEPISGQSSQRSLHAGHYRSGSLSQGVYTDLGRSRSGQQRGSSSSETPSTAPPTPIGKRRDAPLEKPKPAKSKHFSWTPLGFDSMDDTDWANWESPMPVKSTRWSGSTIHSGVMDDIHCIPENAEEVTNSTPIKTKTTVETPKVSPNKLEDLLPNVVNRLSPSNIKRTANNLLDEWEKSLVAPSSARVANKENTAT
ncbi:hypothetical protein EsDP_00001046 [Epichloe bromicola]|uniref:DUF4048 domain-containing protein n=1 Tax=Epichloe bromicola TaxID=79588 RepID=A0ABQ0CGR4_9HYPO